MGFCCVWTPHSYYVLLPTLGMQLTVCVCSAMCRDAGKHRKEMRRNTETDSIWSFGGQMLTSCLTGHTSPAACYNIMTSGCSNGRVHLHKSKVYLSPAAVKEQLHQRGSDHTSGANISKGGQSWSSPIPVSDYLDPFCSASQQWVDHPCSRSNKVSSSKMAESAKL